jgi:hypothetical protein
MVLDSANDRVGSCMGALTRLRSLFLIQVHSFAFRILLSLLLDTPRLRLFRTSVTSSSVALYYSGMRNASFRGVLPTGLKVMNLHNMTVCGAPRAFCEA